MMSNDNTQLASTRPVEIRYYMCRSSSSRSATSIRFKTMLPCGMATQSTRFDSLLSRLLQHYVYQMKQAYCVSESMLRAVYAHKHKMQTR